MNNENLLGQMPPEHKFSNILYRLPMVEPCIVALIAFRDEEQHLPGLFSHLRDYVDGFIAFDDCSQDESPRIAEAELKIISMFTRHVPSPDHHFEIQNRLTLLNAAHECGAHWVLCCDADERFETRFLRDLRTIVSDPPAHVMGLPLVAVWENFQQHRVGRARKYVLFPAVKPRPYYPFGLLHQQWYPPALETSTKQYLDYYIYHLGSLTRADRLGRYEKFNRIDPDKTHQSQGYENLIDESKLVLLPISPERGFVYE